MYLRASARQKAGIRLDIAHKLIGVEWAEMFEHAHLLAYINRGIQNADATNDFSWSAALLVTL